MEHLVKQPFLASRQKYFVIMRGVSGSGKSTYAKKLQAMVWKFSQPPRKTSFMWMNLCAIISADNYFIHPDGEYHFNGRLLGAAHAWCFSEAKRLMEIGVQVLILDNTNTQRWEYEKYIEAAKLFNYKVKERIIGQFDEESLKLYASRNAHGVPQEAIDKMAKRFEK